MRDLLMSFVLIAIVTIFIGGIGWLVSKPPVPPLIERGFPPKASPELCGAYFAWSKRVNDRVDGMEELCR